MLSRTLGCSFRRRFSLPPLVARMSTKPGTVAEPEGVQTFIFPEEPLGVPASEGYGYFQGGPGDVVGPGNRFHLQAKLGFGTNSSVWLAKDLQYVNPLQCHVVITTLL